MFCKNCGKEIDNAAVICPNCGVMQKEISLLEEKKTVNDKEKAVNGFAIAGFVLSIVSLFLVNPFFIVSIICLIIGLIFSAIGCGRRDSYSLSGFAIAGLIISLLIMFFYGILIALAVAIVIAAL